MAIEQMKVWEIVKKSVSKDLDVPEFQREFVWEPDQVKKLAESLYLDYPIGSFLLWDSPDYSQSKTANGKAPSLWIVDGQQRITALCLLMGQKPYWWEDSEKWNQYLKRYDVLVNVNPDQDGDELAFAISNPILQRNPFWISIREVLSSDEDKVDQLITEALINFEHQEKFEKYKLMHKYVERIRKIRDRDIPIIKTSHNVEDIVEIFARLNQEGTRVKQADVFLALAAVQNKGWIHSEYLPLRRNLEDRGWDLDSGIFVRTMTGIGEGRARLSEVSRDFWKTENLNVVWGHTKKTISEVIKRLTEFGISSTELIPSINSLIPLFVLQHRFRDEPSYSFNKALYWFLMANRVGRYSGSSTTRLDEDLKIIFNASGPERALETLRNELDCDEKIAAEEFLSRYDRAGSRFLLLMLYLVLFKRGAKDWIDKTLIGYNKDDITSAAGFKPQWHHIYPRKILVEANCSEDDIQSIGNITILNEQTNAKKLMSMPPSRYIKMFNISAEELRSHLVPEPFISNIDDENFLKTQWTTERYTDFICERAQLIANEANIMLQSLRES